MCLSALMSLSAVPTLPTDFINLSATNCRLVGITNLFAFAATFRPRSSLVLAMSIIHCSNDVSLRSELVDKMFD